MSNEVVSRRKALKLYGMAANWPEVLGCCQHAALGPVALLEQLLNAETAERTVRSIAYPKWPRHASLRTMISRALTLLPAALMNR